MFRLDPLSIRLRLYTHHAAPCAISFNFQFNSPTADPKASFLQRLHHRAGCELPADSKRPSGFPTRRLETVRYHPTLQISLPPDLPAQRSSRHPQPTHEPAVARAPLRNG